jgi:hypothetical protein
VSKIKSRLDIGAPTIGLKESGRRCNGLTLPYPSVRICSHRERTDYANWLGDSSRANVRFSRQEKLRAPLQGVHIMSADDRRRALLRASGRATSAAVMVPNASIAYTTYTVPGCEAPAPDNGYIRGVARMLQDERGDVGVL